MKTLLTRRDAVAAGMALSALAVSPGTASSRTKLVSEQRQAENNIEMKLGLITYNVAKDWDLPTIIDHVKKAGWDGVELRTTHAHGVELSLDSTARKVV